MKPFSFVSRAIVRPASQYAVAAVLVTLWSGVPFAVRAQSSLVPQTNAQAPWSAPVGHRQPSASDLPPDVLRDEGMRTQGMNQQPAPPAHGAPPDVAREQRDQHVHPGPPDDDMRICREC
jgi:cell division protein FtsN